VKRFIVAASLFFLILAALPASADTVAFSTKDGVAVKGDVLYATRECLVVDCWLDAHGARKERRAFRWDEISEPDALRLKRKFGVPICDEPDSEYFLLPGKRITLTGGRTVTGYVPEDECTARNIYVYTPDGRRVKVRRSTIERMEDVTVDIRLCLPTAKVYRILLARFAPVSAADHLRLARICEHIGALREAVRHYRKAMEGDPRYAPFLRPTVERVTRLYRERTAAGLLEQLRGLYRCGKYREASRVLARILDYYSDTRAAKEVEDFRAGIEDGLDLTLTRKVVADYYALLKRKIRKRVLGKVLDGPSRPGFRVTLLTGKVFEGVFTDEFGDPVSPPPPEKVRAEGYDAYFDGEDVIYICDEDSTIYEIPRDLLKEIVPVELNKKLKDPSFLGDQVPYVSGANAPIHEEICRDLAWKYGISVRIVRRMWRKRHFERRDANGRVLRPRCSRKQVVTFLPAQRDAEFASLSALERYNTLLGICASTSMHVIKRTTKVCPFCKGKKLSPPCKLCHNIGSFVTICYR